MTVQQNGPSVVQQYRRRFLFTVGDPTDALVAFYASPIASFDQLYDSFSEHLMDLLALLEQVEETHWLKWFTTNLEIVKRYDRRGLQNILAVFGGMGSFNDLILDPVNGHHLAVSETGRANEKLTLLRTQIYSDAAELLRQLD